MDSILVAQELVRIAKALTAETSTGVGKVYYEQTNVGKTKYVVNYHDGEKTHGDGSPFYDIATFSNKKALAAFLKGLNRDGYKYR